LFGQEGLLSTTNLSLNGGNEETKFFISGLLKADEGIVERTGYDKRAIRVNVDHDLSEAASVRVGANYINAETRRGLTGNDNSGTTFGVALTATPNFDEDDDGDGTSNGVERLNLLGVSARQFVENADYFRLREVGLYYSLPPSLIGNLGFVRQIRIGASANNLFTITPYSSYDPEVNNFGTQPLSTGVEVTPFPSSRTFMFHLNVGL
jgi:hypothetical protein